MYTPSSWSAASGVVFMAIMGLADALLVAWLYGNVSGMAVSAGALLGLMISIAWALRRYLATVSLTLLASAAAITVTLCLNAPPVGLRSAVVAVAVFGVWFLTYDVWFTGRAQTEVVSGVTRLGSDGHVGRALIVHHQGRGRKRFQAHVQRAFAEGLQSQGWQVDVTTASRATPTDLSRYDLLVLGAQSYNWCPARPVVDYLDRLGDLKGKPVVIVVSGGGMTERAIRVLRERVVKAHGAVVDAIEIWTSRPNEERHGLSDPRAILFRAGARLTIPRHQKTA